LGTSVAEVKVKADGIAGFIKSGAGSVFEALDRFSPEVGLRKKLQAEPTLGELIECFLLNQGALGVGDRTAKEYRKAAIFIVKSVLFQRRGKDLSKEEVLQQPVGVITLGLINEYKKVSTGLQSLMGKGQKVDHVRLASKKRTANTKIRNFKALFSQKAMRLYAEEGLQVPDVEKAFSGALFNGVKSSFKLPAVPVILKFYEVLWEKLRHENYEMFKACLMAFYAGLRARECEFARKSWIMEGETPYMHIQREVDFEPKDHEERTTPIASFVVPYLLDNTETPHVIGGSAWAKNENIMRPLAKWLKTHAGVKSLKPLQELRKWYSSYITFEEGTSKAQRFLGHSSPQTTQNYYSDFEYPKALKRLWEEPYSPELVKQVYQAKDQLY